MPVVQVENASDVAGMEDLMIMLNALGHY